MFIRHHISMKLLYLIAAICLFSASTMDSIADTSNKTVAVPNQKFDRDAFRSLLREYIFRQYADAKGVHVESALSALGALSGFAVQEGLRQKLIVEEKQPEDKVFVIVKTNNNETFYFGPFFDQFLLGVAPGRISVWSLVGGGAQKAGAKQLPDIALIARTNAERVGAENYGIPDPIPGHPIKEIPATALRNHWNTVRGILQAKGADPLMWGWEIALVAQDIIIQAKEIIPPDVAARIVMEAAIPMSKIDPRRVGANGL